MKKFISGCVSDIVTLEALGMIVVIFLIIVTSVLSGCTVRPEVSLEDRALISRTGESWKMAFHSWSIKKDCLEHVGVVTPSRENFQRVCGTPAFFSVGCVHERGIGEGPGKVLYISPAVRPNKRSFAVIHTTLHVLVGCSAKKGSDDPMDTAHLLPDVWMDIDGDHSLEKHILGGLIRDY